MVLIYVLYIVYMTFNARIVEAVDSALQRRKDARRAASAPKFPFPIVSATQPPEMNDSALVRFPRSTATIMQSARSLMRRWMRSSLGSEQHRCGRGPAGHTACCTPLEPNQRISCWSTGRLNVPIGQSVPSARCTSVEAHLWRVVCWHCGAILVG